ncbi:MAG: FGGY-family carbohydrate kinase, partial [Actinomycetota bacterium]|nr:FGGY-family carbohydrate kinase [Actinomycetota bacterium]
MSILVIDVGTSGLRAAVVRPDATVAVEEHRPFLPETPEPGLVQFDASALASLALEVAGRVLAEAGPVDAVGITNQRASTIVWDRATGEPVGPGIGWQDLRTVGTCLVLQADGLRLAPNASATKAQWLLDTFDPDRSRDLCVGTVDSWLAWQLSEGALHVIDATNAGVTGLLRGDSSGWDDRILDALRIPAESLPTIVDTSGAIGRATALPGAPTIAALVGDQQSSLVGQGCVARGDAKITFGTGGMLDLHLGSERPTFDTQGKGGCFPIVASRRNGELAWGVEAVMLAAGTNVEWLRDDLGIIATAAESHDVAAQCDHTDGVTYVPALLGLGAPRWDHGARGALLGLTRGSGRPQIVRAVLEGVAQRGADLVESAEADSGLTIPSLRIDGGMSDNPTFVQALADATQRPVEVSPLREATTLGAAFLAGL